jgi:fructose-bisphosphate aldolase class II
VPVFVNADHTYSVLRCKEAIDAQVDSVIIDMAQESFEDNIKATREVVQYAKDRSVLIEGELGFIGQSSKVLEELPQGVSEDTQTKIPEAKIYVEETGIDLFAPSVGNVHGIVKGGEPKLNIKLIADLKDTINVPLVLHGASGNSDEDIRRAVEAGIRIIHINTELRLAYKNGILNGIKDQEIAPYKFMAEGVKKMEEVVINKLKLFNNII